MKHLTHTFLFLLISTWAIASDKQVDQVRAQGGTGFKINEIRTFEATEETIYLEDGNVIPATRAQGGTGFKIRYKASEVGGNVTQGSLDEINLINTFQGPVVSTSPFMVFDVEALLSNKTFLTDDLALTDLSIGDVVKVSGFIDSASSTLITRIERVSSLSQWKLTGRVSALSAGQFNINNQEIAYSFDQVNHCGGTLSEGDLVEIFADEQINFVLGDVLNTVTSIHCIDDSIQPKDSEDTVIIEGFIDELLADGDFVLAGQNILVNQNTRYIRGRSEDIQERIKVEVEGLAEIATGDVTADKIRFLEPRLNITVPVQPEDFTGSQFNVAGVNLFVTPQVQDPDMILVNGVNAPIQIQFRGYDYGSGELHISRLNQRGSVDYDDVNLTGFVTSIDEPVITVFGVNIDTGNTNFFGLDGLPISSTEFFSTVVVGAEIEMEDASLDAMLDTISGGNIYLQELPENESINQLGSDDRAVGVGTLTSLPDQLFSSSFE